MLWWKEMWGLEKWGAFSKYPFHEHKNTLRCVRDLP